METQGNRDAGFKLSNHPVFLSAAVFPGTGQLVQKRWMAAAIYGLVALGLFVMFMVCAAGVLKIYFGVPYFETEAEVEASKDQMMHMAIRSVVFLGLTIVVYVAGILDTFIVQRRRMQRRPPPPIPPQ